MLGSLGDHAKVKGIQPPNGLVVMQASQHVEHDAAVELAETLMDAPIWEMVTLSVATQPKLSVIERM